MFGRKSCSRKLLGLCLGIGIGAAPVRADEPPSVPEMGSEAAPAPTPPVSPAPPEDDTPASPTATRPEAVASGGARAASEAGVPGWLVEPNVNTSGLEWHGNLEMDIGQVNYSFGQASTQPEKVYDWRGRFVFGPMWTHKLGNGLFFRVTGQPVAWIREDYGIYQINVDDVYAQIGKQGVWDLMAGRFLTWRVFRKGLGYDLYTLEDTGARLAQNFTDPTGFFQHAYEVNTIFLRDSNNVPPGRAAFHFYPTSWSGIEAVATYGRQQGGGNVLGGRLAAGLNFRFLNALGAAEYVTWRPAWAVRDPNTSADQPFKACDTCGNINTSGLGGSVAFTPLPWLEAVVDGAHRKTDSWDTQQNVQTTITNNSWGGYLQLDPGYLIARSSLIVGGGFFRVEYLSNDNASSSNNQIYQRHDQMAGYLVYPLGFNNAVAKLIYSRATGHQEKGGAPNLNVVDGDMWSLRFRVAFYF
jgi:hypothetical protein